MTIMHHSQAIDMTWSRQRRFDRFVLRAAETNEVQAILTRHRGSWFVGEAGSRRWSLRCAGLLEPRVVVREIETGVEVAVLHLDSGGDGALEFANGNRYAWRVMNHGRREFALLNARNLPVVKARSSRGDIQVLVLDETVEELPVLLLLTAYITITMTASDGAVPGIASFTAIAGA